MIQNLCFTLSWPSAISHLSSLLPTISTPHNVSNGEPITTHFTKTSHWLAQLRNQERKGRLQSQPRSMRTSAVSSESSYPRWAAGGSRILDEGAFGKWKERP